MCERNARPNSVLRTKPPGCVWVNNSRAESADIGAGNLLCGVLSIAATAAPLIVAITEGGVEIEAVAAKSPEKIIRTD